MSFATGKLDESDFKQKKSKFEKAKDVVTLINELECYEKNIITVSNVLAKVVHTDLKDSPDIKLMYVELEDAFKIQISDVKTKIQDIKNDFNNSEEK